MVFKPISLARSVISKTFPNGYAQSLVAATQSSSATHNTHLSSFSNNVVSYFGKTGPSGQPQPLQHGHQNTLSGSGTKPDTTADRGLDAYYAAWHKHHRAEDREWHQFQFAKRIGWKAPTTIPESQAQAKPASSTAAISEPSNRPPIHRAQSASAYEDIKNTELANSRLVEQNTGNPGVLLSSAELPGVVDGPTAQKSGSPASITSTGTPNLDTWSPVQSTEATSVSDGDQYTDHLAFLAENQRHAEIPAVFEAMLQNGIKPTPTAYNALLLAAIHLPKGKHQVVPKVLDVYSDMARRHVKPDTATYAVLIEVLAARALDVRAMKQNLVRRRFRYSSSEKRDQFLLPSDEAEYRIVAEDDSLSFAIKLFDTSAAVTTNHAFPADTYRLLISACAEQGRIDDMVRIYAEMESQQITPPTDIFAPMVVAFATVGDLRSAIECYDEYKAVAIAHDNGLKQIVRKDADVYAAVVNAYAICDQTSSGLKFLAKVEDSLEGSTQLAAIRDMVAVQALIPKWLAERSYSKAISHTMEHLSSQARISALSSICVAAADNDDVSVASATFAQLVQLGNATIGPAPATALLSAFLRLGQLDTTDPAWQHIKQCNASGKLIEPTTMFAKAFISAKTPAYGLAEARQMFARIRDSAVTVERKSDLVERIGEAVGVITGHLVKVSPIIPADVSLEMIQIMSENGTASNTFAEHVLAPLGPAEITSAHPSALRGLILIQARLLAQNAGADASHVARFSHMVELMARQGLPVDQQTYSAVETALNVIQRSDLGNKWRNMNHPSSVTLISPTYSPPTTIVAPAYEDSYDPYGSSTDFKGSTVIADELEKTYGRHSTHLSEALVKFKNMRRVGRHPRYVTYAKLITAAAKENRLGLANDILAMAKQDIPLIPGSRIVTNGWISILDAMVGACLTVGHRDAAAQYHQDLINIGSAPSANTFGLYITTLKESTKTFDEATEAVKIFHRAKTEGVEPTSFLYNALIGKLGKARRIDDCLFYFAEMRNQQIRPTSVTYGTIVNALCRVSDDKFAEELFEEMESMPNYKPRPAPYNSMMQYFLTTKRDRAKVLTYYERMRARKIDPTMHTYKLLIDTHATLDPVDMPAAEAVLDEIRSSGSQPEAVHFAALIHAKGCVMHDLRSARDIFESVIAEGRIAPQASLYQAMFESMVANHDITETEPLMKQMADRGVDLTPYIANTLIHGWALVKDVTKARAVYDTLGMEKREPSTYEAMTRAYLAVEEHGSAMGVVGEALRRGYPSAVANKICDLVGGGRL